MSLADKLIVFVMSCTILTLIGQLIAFVRIDIEQDEERLKGSRPQVE